MNAPSVVPPLKENNRKEWQFDVTCARCNDIIYSRYSGQFVTCKCGAISVDQTPYYSRYTGNPEDFVVDNNSSK
jgi:hypothetical protein